jgi:hypothetical protein
MKNVYCIVLVFLTLTNSHAQKTEFRIIINSALFSFAGQSAESKSFMIYNAEINSYTNNPYGSKNGLCYGLSVNAKRINKSNIVFGFDLGYEVLRSNTSIISVNVDNTVYDAKGQTFLNYGFINLNPQIGYRVDFKKVSFDFLLGLDIAYCLNATEKGKATASNGITYSTLVDRKTINQDLRQRIQLSVDYNKVGVFLGYSYGVLNYKSGYLGGINESYARIIRFGFTYQIE